MAQQTYQIAYDARTQTMDTFDILKSVAENALAYGLDINNLQYVSAQGRVRITLSDPLPAAEVASFNGAIVAL